MSNSELDFSLSLPHYDFEPADFDPYAGKAVRHNAHDYKGPCEIDEDYRSDALRTALAMDLPPCSFGTFPVKAEDLVLYFGKAKNNLGRIDFSAPEDESLRQLAGLCDVATFGLNDKNVLDETYRKAGKLDSQYFAAKFDPVATGLLARLRDMLLVGHSDDMSIRPELYKLNVYGPGSFFKSHKDTPRGDDMFASLVIVLPTVHKGGHLHFRHENIESTFDSATSLSQADCPSIAFAAFYSDVEHEVSRVESGYRVTLTYNLYYDSTPSTPPATDGFAATQERALQIAFSRILAAKSFLPEGGYVAFGLSHQYAYATRKEKTTSLSEISTLKGKDAMLMKVCKELSLNGKVQVVYEDFLTAGPVICDKVIPHGEYYWEDYDWTRGMEALGGRLIGKSRRNRHNPIPSIEVKWITPAKTNPVTNEVDSHFAQHYGNEPGKGHAYGNFCFLVEIKRP